MGSRDRIGRYVKSNLIYIYMYILYIENDVARCRTRRENSVDPTGIKLDLFARELFAVPFVVAANRNYANYASWQFWWSFRYGLPLADPIRRFVYDATMRSGDKRSRESARATIMARKISIAILMVADKSRNSFRRTNERFTIYYISNTKLLN